MLARAKEAPLHLEACVGFNWDHARYIAFDKELQAHLSHIRHLNIIAGTDYLSTTSLRDTLLASPAPILEYFSLSNYNITGTLSISDHVFKGITPRLSYLQLNDIDFSWKSSLLRGLRYLNISGPQHNNRPSVTDWLDALDKMH